MLFDFMLILCELLPDKGQERGTGAHFFLPICIERLVLRIINDNYLLQHIVCSGSILPQTKSMLIKQGYASTVKSHCRIPAFFKLSIVQNLFNIL